MQNGFCESFNGRMRDKLLNVTPFLGLDYVRTRIADWLTFKAKRSGVSVGNVPLHIAGEVHGLAALHRQRGKRQRERSRLAFLPNFNSTDLKSSKTHLEFF